MKWRILSQPKGIAALFLTVGSLAVFVFVTNTDWRQNEQPLPTDPQMLFTEVVGSPENVQLLLERGVNPNYRGERGRTCLFRAVAFKKVEVVRMLLNAGAEVNVADESGVTPLLECAIWFNDDPDSLTIAKLLLDRGADKNVKCFGSGQGITGILGEVSLRTILDRYGDKRHVQEFRKLVGLPPKAQPQPARVLGDLRTDAWSIRAS